MNINSVNTTLKEKRRTMRQQVLTTILWMANSSPNFF